MKGRKSLGFQLMLSFIITSIIPIVLMNLFSYYNTTGIVRDSITEMTDYNLEQTSSSVSTSLESYQDVLYQIYSDDEVIELVDKLNNGENIVVSKNQLQRKLRGYFYAKDYIRSITVVTTTGTSVFWDAITGSSAQNSWMIPYGVNSRELYETVSQADNICLLPSKKAATMANTDNYLFHIGRKIVDYNHRNKQIGVIVMSIDETLLKEVCGGGRNRENSFNFIVDRDGYIISFPDPGQVGRQIEDYSINGEGQYEDFVRASGLYEGEKIMIHTLYDEETGWTVVNVVNQDGTFARLNTQQSLLIGILAASLIFLAVMIRFFTKNLTGSVRKVVSVMRDVEEGKRDSRIRIDSKMPREVETIAVQYNNMMDRLDESVRKEQELGRQKQKAEITALEAQINPHFLYNILDTINWIAIGKKDFEISRAISALAAIMRYGIDNSNGVVTIRDEYEWLKQYLLLQQTRLRDGFESRISIQPEAMDIKVHKLLIQPFVENAVMHGFKGIHRKAVLGVEIEARGESGLKIEIYDNGRGMPEETVARLNRGEFPETDGKSHIGMKNAMERIKIYYGASSQVHIESRENEYTRVIIRIQETSGDTADEDNCSGR